MHYWLVRTYHPRLATHQGRGTASRQAIHSPSHLAPPQVAEQRAPASVDCGLRTGPRPSASGSASARSSDSARAGAWPYLVVKHGLRVAAFMVALHRQPRELHGVPLQRRRVHGAQAPSRGRQTGPDAGPRRRETLRREPGTPRAERQSLLSRAGRRKGGRSRYYLRPARAAAGAEQTLLRALPAAPPRVLAPPTGGIAQAQSTLEAPTGEGGAQFDRRWAGPEHCPVGLGERKQVPSRS